MFPKLDPTNNIAFQKIFACDHNKDILINFINDIMNFDAAEKVQDVKFLKPIQDPEFAYMKQSLVDVLCKTESGEQIIIEIHVAPLRWFTKRAQDYAAKAYFRQLSQGQEQHQVYPNLKEVIILAITDYIRFPHKSAHISYHVTRDKESNHQVFLKDFSFTFIELPKFNIENIDDLKDRTDKWCYFLKNAANTSKADRQKLIGTDSIIGRAFEELNPFNWSEEEFWAYEIEFKRRLDNRAVEDYMIEEAEKKVNQKVARNLKRRNISIEIISIITDLTIKEIEELTLDD